MKNRLIPIIILILLIFTCACASPTNQQVITSAGLYLDPDGREPTGIYDARAIFYYIITLKQPLPDSTLRASWVAVETNRLEPNSVLKIDEIVPTSSPIIFTLQNQGNFWPTGNYKVYLYLDGREIQAIDFEVYHDYFSE